MKNLRPKQAEQQLAPPPNHCCHKRLVGKHCSVLPVCECVLFKVCVSSKEVIDESDDRLAATGHF